MDKTANLLLRAGVAFAFLYPPYAALGDPASWLGYFPSFMRLAAQAGGVPDMVLLHSFGALEIVIALWILSGWKIVWPAAAATAILLSIIFFGWNDFEVLFRDLSIAAAAAALAVDSLRKTPQN